MKCSASFSLINILDGKNGTSVSITSKEVVYQTSSSGTSTPSGEWATTPTPVTGQYLWTRTTVNYSDGTSTVSYSVAYAGTNGDKGADGTSMKIADRDAWTRTYAELKAIENKADGWTLRNAFTGKVGDILWFLCKVTDQNNAVGYLPFTVTSFSGNYVRGTNGYLIYGEKGATGAQGATGASVTTTKQYTIQSSADLTTEDLQAIEDSNWLDEELVTWAYGKYLYSRTKTLNISTGTASYTYNGRATELEEYFKKQLKFNLLTDRSTYTINKRSTETQTITLKIDEQYYIPTSYVWTSNGETITPTQVEGNSKAYTYEIAYNSTATALKIEVVPYIGETAITGVSASVTLTPDDQTSYYLFIGDVDELPEESSNYLSGDSCYYTAENVIYVYNGSGWTTLATSSVSDSVKMTILAKAEKVAFEYAISKGLSSDYGYFDTLFTKYVKARIIGAETIQLTGDDGMLVGGDWETTDTGGYLVNQGVYIDSSGLAKFTQAYLNNCFIKGGNIEALTVSGEIINDVLTTSQTSSAGSAISVGSISTSTVWYKGSQAKTLLKSKIASYNTVYSYSGVYAGKSYSKVIELSSSAGDTDIDFSLSSITSPGSDYITIGKDSNSKMLGISWTKSSLQVRGESWTETKTVTPPISDTSRSAGIEYGAGYDGLYCYDYYNTGKLYFSSNASEGQTWTLLGTYTGLFTGSLGYCSLYCTSSGIFLEGADSGGDPKVYLYSSTNREWYRVASSLEALPSAYCEGGGYIGFFAQWSSYWRFFRCVANKQGCEICKLTTPSNTVAVWYIQGGGLFCYTSSGVIYRNSSWTPATGATSISAQFKTIGSTSTPELVIASASSAWGIYDGSSLYLFYKGTFIKSYSYTLLAETLRKPYCCSSPFLFFMTSGRTIYKIVTVTYGYQSGLNFLNSYGIVIAYESEMNDYMQSQTCTMYNGSTTLVNLPSSIPSSMDVYRKIPTLYNSTNTYASIYSINIESFVRFDTSINSDVTMSAVTTVPSMISISPSSLVIDGVEKLNSSWFIKNKTSLTATFTPNSKSAGVETGDLNPKTTTNSIGGITPYNVIKGNTIQATTITADKYDGLFPVGAIYMSTTSTSPASIFGGTWTRLYNRFLIGGGSSYSVGATGGESSHTLSSSEMPSHSHSAYIYDGSFSESTYLATRTVWFDNGQSALYVNWSGTTKSHIATITATTSSGSGSSHNNMPPYQAVYMWKRTS